MKKERIIIFYLLLIACFFTACGNNEESKSAEITSEQDSFLNETVSSNEESEGLSESKGSEAESSAEASEFASEESHVHTFGEWVISKKATCLEEGTKERLCSCGEKESETIKATGHIDGEWVTDTKATCVKEGSKHLACANCSEILKTETIKVTGKHSYLSQVTTAANCTKDGVKTFTCKTCDDSYTEVIKAAHKWINATCTAPKTCSVCKETEGKALNHTTNNGKCSRCGTMNIKTPTQLLGEYVTENGYQNSYGNYVLERKYISEEENSTTSIFYITWNPTKQSITLNHDSSKTKTTVFLNPDSNKLNAINIYEAESGTYTSTCYIYKDSYLDDYLKIIYSYYSDAPSYLKDAVKDLCGTCVFSAVSKFYFLLDEIDIGISFSDFGFQAGI